MLSLTFLGTGTSNGVPMIGCDCDVCTSSDPRDVRTRTSAYLVWGGLHLLIDTATELRLQALQFGIREVDAVLFTHAHADHTISSADSIGFTALPTPQGTVFLNATRPSF